MVPTVVISFTFLWNFFFVLSILQHLIAFNSILKASFGTSSLPSLNLGYSDGRPLKQTGRVGW